MKRAVLLSVLLAAVLALSFAAVAVRADEVVVSNADAEAAEAEAEAAGEEDAAGGEQGFLQPHPSVKTTYVFPEHHGTGSLPLGEIVEVTCGFRNDADEPLNITTVLGSLHYPTDHRMMIQNYSAISYQRTVVPPKAEVSLAYYIRADPMLEARDYTVTVYVLYTDLAQRQEYVSVFVNQTVEFVETGTDYSLVLFTVALAGSVIGAVYYFGNRAFGALRKSRPSSSSSSAAGTSAKATTHEVMAARAADTDFVPAHVLKTVKSRSPAKAKSPSRASASQ